MYKKRRGVKIIPDGWVVIGFVLFILLLTQSRDEVTSQPFPLVSHIRDGKGLIAFESDRDGDVDIYLMNPDGTNVRRLTMFKESERSPAWSPDGRKIAFHAYFNSDSDIFVIDVDSGNIKQLTQNVVNDQDPTWSPDGKKIAYVSGPSAAPGRINIMNADGSNIRRFTDSPGYSHGTLDWSPDGTQLLFYTSYDDNRYIYTMNLDGRNLIQLTFGWWDSWDPNWSPDGSKIAFRTGGDTYGEIYVMDADGSNMDQLTNPFEFSSSPTWSPDGKQIAFQSTPDNLAQIFVMDADGKNLRQLTDTRWNNSSPAWSP